MEQPVEDRDCDCCVFEDVAPFRDSAVRRQDDGAVEVAA